jgi:hypothetical protein
MYLDLREVSDTQNAHTHSTDGVNVKQQSRISNWISQTGFSDWPFQSTNCYGPWAYWMAKSRQQRQ